MNKINKSIFAEISATKKSLKSILVMLKKLYTVTLSVFVQPGNTFYGVTAGLATILLAFWFANIGIIESVFTSNAISFNSKLYFLLSMLSVIIRNLDPLQLCLILIHLILWCFVGAFWIESIKIQHERPLLKARFAPVVFATLAVGTVAVLAISLVTPVLTRLGISVFVSDHFSGTILLIITILAEVVLLKKFARHILATNKNY